MQRWQSLLKNSITRPDDLPPHHRPEDEGRTELINKYPMRINPYYLSLIRQINDPIWQQAVPAIIEADDQVCYEDPLDEENLSKAPNLIHKYPDRVLFLVTSQCAMYCRFCTRKRKVGTRAMEITPKTIDAGIAYIEKTPAVRDVLISGGDPLLLADDQLEDILTRLRAIDSVEIIRLGTRALCTLPQRITTRLAKLLKKFHPLYINTHFNHPWEITTESSLACQRLADAGIPLGCQTVLLKGVNDQPVIIKKLMHDLLKIRVKPYYLFQTDMTRGTNHFRTSVSSGRQIMRELIGHTSGLAVPTYAVDAPGGGGKIPLTPDYIQQEDKEKIVFTNYCGHTCTYDLT